MINRPRPFLIDVDGVCVEWLPTFVRYMATTGHKPIGPIVEHDLTKAFPEFDNLTMINRIECFQQTSDYRHLPLISGASEGLDKLRNLFPKSAFVAVSSCGTDGITVDARRYQLRHLPFDCLFTLPVASSKQEVFAQFSAGVVIDDLAAHVHGAMELGHMGVLFDQPYNQKDTSDHPNFYRAMGWPKIVEQLS